MKLTAIICTRNRSSWTRLAVASLVAQDLPADQLDILVVDNGSTDDTPEVLKVLADQHSNVRWIAEPLAGLSLARNRGIEDARGDVVAFLDDDAEACASWARLHLAVFEDDTVLASGGRIVLEWPGDRPDWLPIDQEESMYSALDLGPEPKDFDAPSFPFGANMAIRRSVFDRIGMFSPELGRRGRSLVSYEELDLFDRMRAIGGRIAYVPDASVVHHVLPDRVNRRWLLRRFYAQGRSKVLMDELRTQRGRGYWFARTCFQLARGARLSGTAAGRIVTSRKPTEVTGAAMRAAQAVGTARESFRVTVHRRPPSPLVGS